MPDVLDSYAREFLLRMKKELLESIGRTRCMANDIETEDLRLAIKLRAMELLSEEIKNDTIRLRVEDGVLITVQ